MIVADSSTLILLAKAGILDLVIESVATPITVTDVVAREATIKRTDDAVLIHERIKQKKICVIKARVDLAAEIGNKFRIGKGEAEALALAVEHRGLVFTDDKKAMRGCQVLRCDYMTTPNLLVELYKKKKISKEEARRCLEKIEEHGRYAEEFIARAEAELT